MWAGKRSIPTGWVVFCYFVTCLEIQPRLLANTFCNIDRKRGLNDDVTFVNEMLRLAAGKFVEFGDRLFKCRVERGLIKCRDGDVPLLLAGVDLTFVLGRHIISCEYRTNTLNDMGHRDHLSDEEKRQLVRDGFVILKNVVPRDIRLRARRIIDKNPQVIVHGDNNAINGLYNDSVLAAVLDEAMGPHTRPINAQVAVTMPHYADAVVRTQIDVNNVHGPVAHVDGGWAGVCPVKRSEILASGQSLHSWGSDGDPQSMGPAGHAPLWQDRERTVAIGSYTALVVVCLSDQIQPGKGQFSVRRGAHEAVGAFFRKQRDQGGPLGGGGPLWPRLIPADGDRAMAGMMPRAMVDAYPDTRFEDVDWPWPELTPTLMAEGDAVIALHALPHTATPNLSEHPRMNVFFRIRRLRPENPYEGDPRVGWGVSDHPDRALNGDFLEYPASYDPYQTSVDKMCDHWSEWSGMEEIVSAKDQVPTPQ